MEKYEYQYEPVYKTDDLEKETPKLGWTPFLRQVMVCSGLWTAYFASGLALGSPTVIIPQIRRQANSSAAIDDEMASWLSSVLGISSIPWVIVMPFLTHKIGRKKPFILVCSASVVGFLIFYFGPTPIHFILSQVIQGILFSSNLTVSIIMVTEYTSPQYRGIFLSIKSASVFWGMWAANAIGTFFDWHNIGLFGLIISISYLHVFFWPESPYWLASKGRFNECAKAHRWLKGTDKLAERELESLINSQKEHLSTHIKHNKFKDKVINFCKTMTCTEFYKPVSLSILVMAQFHASGKIVCSMYSIELIKKITDSESTAYIGMLILDGASVAGMYFGSALSKFIKRRTLLIFSSVIGIMFLFLLSLYLWLVKMSFISENKIVSVALLFGFFITISCGPMIMSTSIYGELVPLKFKSSAVLVIVMFHTILMSVSLKVAPFIFRTISLHGTFAFYGTLASVLTYFLYKYLPETKDKSLQEIEDYFKDKN